MKSQKLGFKVGLFGVLAAVGSVLGPGIGVVQAQPEHVAVVADAVRAPRLGAQELLVTPKPIASEAVEMKRRLRRLKRAELSTEMMLASAELVKQSYGKRIGTEVALEVEGKLYVARLERHFHPEGGPVKPWGYHPGISLFAVEWRPARP